MKTYIFIGAYDYMNDCDRIRKIDWKQCYVSSYI